MTLSTIIQNIIKIMSKYWDVFLIKGVSITLALSAITVAFGAVLGSLLALMKMSRFKTLRGLVTAFVEVIRGTPLLLQLYIGYFIVPLMVPALELGTFASISVALVINSAAYVSEVIRSGIQAVDIGQTEAARSLGLNKTQTMTKVILPQAVKNILPALGNEFVTIIKETSLASTFFVGDLMTAYLTVKGATYLAFESLIIVGVIYFVLTFTLSKLVGAYERRLKQSD
jgi:His/Glu/Gln/Arg/opine family amino acid ABC transporter permease subunit